MHPLVKKMVEIKATSGMTWLEIVKKSGVLRTTMSRWRNPGRDPYLGAFIAVLNTLGYDLAIVPLEKPEPKPQLKSRW